MNAYTPGQAAKILHITRPYLAQLVREHKVPCSLDENGRRIYSQGDINAAKRYLSGERVFVPKEATITITEFQNFLDRQQRVQKQLRKAIMQPVYVCAGSFGIILALLYAIL